MRLAIGAVGRLKEGPERLLYTRYAERIAGAGRSLSLGPLDLIELSESKAAQARERMSQEAAALSEKLRTCSYLISLDERGKSLTSRDFALKLQNLRDEGQSQIGFVIGGADGLDPDLKTRTHMSLSLSSMTLPHGLARIILAEQIYRAVTILSGHPYHRE